MNPPYGRGIDVYPWVSKAYYSAQNPRTIGVCLLPASIDTKWFHEFCMKSYEIRFVRERLWFSRNGVPSRANHGSIVVVFAPYTNQVPKISTISKGKNEMIEKTRDSKEIKQGYGDFVRQKHITDICHQLEMLGYRGRTVELNHFRASLEAILLHTDPCGGYDIKYNEK